MDRARRLLASGEMTVTEVCFDVDTPAWDLFLQSFNLWLGARPASTSAKCAAFLVSKNRGILFWFPSVIFPRMAEQSKRKARTKKHSFAFVS